VRKGALDREKEKFPPLSFAAKNPDLAKGPGRKRQTGQKEPTPGRGHFPTGMRATAREGRKQKKGKRLGRRELWDEPEGPCRLKGELPLLLEPVPEQEVRKKPLP